MSKFEEALEIALTAHRQQVDKGGAPYILHPLRVMLNFDTDEARQAALLHDVVEDSDWTLEKLCQAEFTENVISAIKALTRRPGEDYFEFIQRAAAHPLARMIKKADLLDNMNLARISNPSAKDFERLQKYEKAIKMIENLENSETSGAIIKAIQAGNPPYALTIIEAASFLGANEKEILKLLLECQKNGVRRKYDLSYQPPFYKVPQKVAEEIAARLPECSTPSCDGRAIFSGYYTQSQNRGNDYLVLCDGCLLFRGEWFWICNSQGWDNLVAASRDEEIVQEPLIEKVRKITIG